MSFRFAFWLGLCVAAIGCTAETTGLVDVVEQHPGQLPISPATECVVTTAREPASDRSHVENCSALEYPRHPPAGGRHYGGSPTAAGWADFGVYDAPIPWGFLVHSLEHGAVVLAYNCPDGCPDVLAAFDRIRTDVAAGDELCRAHPAGSRVIVMPDPTLDVAIAAVTWEHLYLATCLDEPSLSAFVAANYGNAPEDLCISGFAPVPPAPWCP